MSERTSWQCGGCGKWKAPHVDTCDCASYVPQTWPTVPYVPVPIYPLPIPTYPTYPQPPWIVTCGDSTRRLS